MICSTRCPHSRTDSRCWRMSSPRPILSWKVLVQNSTRHSLQQASSQLKQDTRPQGQDQLRIISSFCRPSWRLSSCRTHGDEQRLLQQQKFQRQRKQQHQRQLQLSQEGEDTTTPFTHLKALRVSARTTTSKMLTCSPLLQMARTRSDDDEGENSKTLRLAKEDQTFENRQKVAQMLFEKAEALAREVEFLAAGR